MEEFMNINIIWKCFTASCHANFTHPLPVCYCLRHKIAYIEHIKEISVCENYKLVLDHEKL